jgi:hypothetical protein
MSARQDLQCVFAGGDGDQFFAPASTDLIDGLVAQYQAMLARIQEVGAMVTGETAGAIGYFLEGNSERGRHGVPGVAHLFEVKGAVAALNSAYWSKAMHMTDVLNVMPQKRRDEWNNLIQEKKCPDFEYETVRSTLSDLLDKRHMFLAERVDGIFRGLSGEHVTNSPAAFGKRMIVARVLNEYGHTNFSVSGLINDLRSVVAKFMGRDDPNYRASEHLIYGLKGRWGEWVQVDGNSLKIRLYKKGTAHIEVHPNMAWRLNSVLASIYPLAIPSEFRRRPKKNPKEIELIQRPLPFAVLNALSNLKQAKRMVELGDWVSSSRYEFVANTVSGDLGSDKHIAAEARNILESIGGVKTKEGWWQFDYDPMPVIDTIVTNGCVPDQKSHQFYPTPESVAEAAIDLAEIEDHHACLEPSAGTGGLADHMPKEKTLCIEVSGLRCGVLKAKGYDTVQEDFIAFAGKTTSRFDRIVMNPPFDQGRWMAHLEAAACLLAPTGRLVAILPASAKGKDLLPGLECVFPKTFDNEFSGTSVSVVIMVASAKSGGIL